MAVNGLARVRMRSVGDRPHVAWAEGMRFNVPASLIDQARWSVDAAGDLLIPNDTAPIDPSHAVSLRERRAFTDKAPVSARLPFSYQTVPGPIRAAMASAIGRWNRRRVDRWAVFPAWPIDLSADLLCDLSHPSASETRTTSPVVLTHDVDSPEGLRHLVSEFLPIEEAFGARSTSYIVPCAWPIDHTLADEVVARGHELGIHGYDHSNRTAFSQRNERARRLDAARPFADRYGMIGYRAPSLLRTRALLRDLRGRYQYDSSIPTSGGLFPVPNNGCATARPFLVEDIVELPVTLPRDGSLRFLGHSPDEIVRMWIECADLIGRARGVVVLLTHCEWRFSGNPAMLAAYRKFLEYVRERSDRFTFGSPRSVLQGALGRLESDAGTRVAAP